jgi:hypothetical protein
MLSIESLVKYLLEGIAVAIVAYYIPQRKTSPTEIAIIAFTAALTFLILDVFSPGVAAGTRQGAGFGVGYRLVTGGAAEGEEDSEDEEDGAALPM